MKKIYLLAVILGFTAIQSTAFAGIYEGEDSYLENYELRSLAKAPKLTTPKGVEFNTYGYEATIEFTGEKYLVQRNAEEGWDDAWDGTANLTTGLNNDNDSRIKATWRPETQHWLVEYRFEDLDAAFGHSGDSRSKYYSFIFKKS